MWTADRTCERREGVDESGEQPEGQPNRLVMTTGSKRPGAQPKRQRERRGERRKGERQTRQCNANVLHVVFHFPTASTETATPAAAATVRLQ